MSSSKYAAGEELSTAYAGTRDEWAGLLGSSHAQLRGLRRILMSLVFVLGLSLCGLVALAFAKRNVVVYGIETDKIGQVALRGPLQREFVASDANTRFYLGQFVDFVRRVTADPPLTQRGRVSSYWFATKRGQNILTQHYEGVGSPAALAKEGTVSVEVTSTLKITVGSWQIDWIERRRDVQGNATGETVWRGSFHVRTRVPQDEEELEKNPIGMYVDEFNWVKLKG
jgi:type IV secretory pathway TrbF-like protein